MSATSRWPVWKDPENPDNDAVKKALDDITSACETGGNLLAACLPAVRARATVGEISDAMEKVFTRFVATTQCISGVYAPERGSRDPGFPAQAHRRF